MRIKCDYRVKDLTGLLDQLQGELRKTEAYNPTMLEAMKGLYDVYLAYLRELDRTSAQPYADWMSNYKRRTEGTE